MNSKFINVSNVLPNLPNIPPNIDVTDFNMNNNDINNINDNNGLPIKFKFNFLGEMQIYVWRILCWI